MYVPELVNPEIALRLLFALLIGALIGMERSYHGRPAGFRTHGLVCLASAVLMLVTVYESEWFGASQAARTIIDPTRMAQGIMTGIGFLGAGAIMKEGLTIRGLTTAASIWITAAIGILVGIGFYLPAGLAAALTLGTLSVFRWIESRMPNHAYSDFLVRFDEAQAMSENALRGFVTQHKFSVSGMHRSYRRGDAVVEYRMTLRTQDPAAVAALCTDLRAREEVVEFRVAPAGD
ncbi:MAG: MgtC/SapB family protein [Burkholderiales bacterium]|nr:MgtC/SapB family protein [Burkholderiales bacterium]